MQIHEKVFFNHFFSYCSGLNAFVTPERTILLDTQPVLRSMFYYYSWNIVCFLFFFFSANLLGLILFLFALFFSYFMLYSEFA